MPRIKAEEREDQEGSGNVLIEHVGVVEGERQDITVDVSRFGKFPPTLRINRIVVEKTSNKVKALGTLKTEAEVEGLAAILPKAAKALGRALKATK